MNRFDSYTLRQNSRIFPRIKTHTKIAFANEIKTSRLPMSLAFLDSGCASFDMRSIIVSIAVFANSISKIKTKEKTRSIASMRAIGNIKATHVPTTNIRTSHRNAASDLNAAAKPDAEYLHAFNMRLISFISPRLSFRADCRYRVFVPAQDHKQVADHSGFFPFA